MSTVLFRFERKLGELIRAVKLDTDFIPKVGESINAHSVFDDVEAELGKDGWFFTVYEIRWSVEGTRLEPTVFLACSQRIDRKRIMAVERGEPPQD